MQSKKKNTTSKKLKTKTKGGLSVDEIVDKEIVVVLIKLGTLDTIPLKKYVSRNRGTPIKKIKTRL